MKKYSVCVLIIIFLMLVSTVHASEKAPPFETTDHKGNEIKSQEFLGKNPTLLVFWTQWCVYCRAEMPKLSALYKKYSPKGLRIYAINRDNADDRHKAIKYIDDLGLPFPVIIDAKRIHYDYKALTIPFLVAINAEGNIISRGFSLEDMQTSVNALTENL